MRSALRTFTSALGVCAACYLLSTASWQQVLLLFMVASFGWCWFAFSSGLEVEKAQRAPRMTPSGDDLLSNMPLQAVPSQMSTIRQDPQTTAQSIQRQQPVRVQPVQRVQKVYRFPIHELTRPTLTPAID